MLSLTFYFCAALGAGAYAFGSFVLKLNRTTRDFFASVGFIALAISAALQIVVDSFRETPTSNEELISWGILYASAAFLMSRLINKTWKPSNNLLLWLQRTIGTAALMAFPGFQIRYAVVLLNSTDGSPERYGIGNLVALTASGMLAMAALAAQWQRCKDASEGDEPLDRLLAGLSLAMLARGMSFDRFDAWWVSSYTVSVACWTVFLVETAFKNAASHKQAQEYAMESQALHKVSWALVGTTSPMEFFNLLTSTVREITGAQIVCLFIADESGNALESVGMAGPDICLESLGTVYPVKSPERRPGFHSGHTARAFLTKEIQTADDVFVDVELVPWRMIARDDGRAISLPIVHNDTCLGVLDVYFSDKRDATAQRIRLLETIVAAATVSIKIARSSLLTSMETRKWKKAA